MVLLSLQNLSLSFGGPPLLDGLNLQVHQGEKIGLLGRNGEGKSCLMKLICRQMEADKGEIARQQGVKIGYLAQEVPQDMNGTVLQTLQNAAQSAVQNSNHNDMDDQDSWRTQKQVEIITVQMHLDPQAYVNTLSAGLRRRVLLARYEQSLSLDEIAAQEGRTRKAVESLLRRARQGLRRALSKISNIEGA